MKITEEQFDKVIRRAFAHGIACAPYFDWAFNKSEKSKRLLEIVEDCRRYLYEG